MPLWKVSTKSSDDDDVQLSTNWNRDIYCSAVWAFLVLGMITSLKQILDE